MRNRIFTRLAAGLLCGALLFTDAASLNVWAVSNELDEEQTAPLEESAAAEETEEKEAENPDQEADVPEGNDAPVIEGDEEVTLPVEEEPESVSENAVEEDVVGKDVVAEETSDADFVMAASDGDIASGSYQDTTWKIDANGKLTVYGQGDFADPSRKDSASAPWYRNRYQIKTAEISLTGVTNASYMFYNCRNLTSIDMTNFDTSSVTDMRGMFDDCENLTRLDLSSKFNTDSVTDMSDMFNNCQNLTALDVSNFVTSKVTDMNHMFYNCRSLTELSVSNFVTNEVKDMNNMFYNCRSLTELDVSNFVTSKVKDMAQMFVGCRSLTALDVSNFVTNSVTNMRYMFQECGKLSTLNVSNFITNNVTQMDAMFCGCASLTSLEVSNFNTGSVTDMRWMFRGCASLTALDLSNFNTSNVTDMRFMFYGCSKLTTLDVSNFNTSNVMNMCSMFHGCANLTTLDLSHFDTSNVTDMSEMFYLCGNLTTLDVSNFNTNNVTDMRFMFYGCSKLTTLDVSNFNTSNVMNMCSMFHGCANLTTLNLSSFDTAKCDDMSSIFEDCDYLTTIYTPRNLTQSVSLPTNADDKWYRSDGTVVTELPRDLNYSVTLGRNYKPNDKNPGEPEESEDIASGTSNDISWVIDADGKLTVNGNGDWENKTVDSHRWTPWYEYRDLIKTAKINVRDMTDASYMFFECENLTDIDLTNFNTYYVTNMASMFSGCKKLETLNLNPSSSYDVTDMSRMFYGCESLTDLDLNHISVNNVTSMCEMFAGCTALTKLDLFYGSTDPSNVTDMSGMFKGCSKLVELKLPDSKYKNLTDMSSMFYGCSKLLYLDLGHCIVPHVTNMKDMFYGCETVRELDLSNFNLGSVTDEESIFTLSDCQDLEVIYTPRNLRHSVTLRNFWIGKKWRNSDGTEVTELPKNQTESVVLKYGQETPKNIAEGTSGNVTWVIDANRKLKVSGTGDFERRNDKYPPWYNYHESIRAAEVTVTDMTDASYMFYDCINLSDIDIQNFDTDKATNVSHMFENCSRLGTIDLSNFDTSNVMDMSYMFEDCYRLEELDLRNFSNNSVTNMHSMFARCYNLTSINLENFGSGYVTDMHDMFSGCRNLTTLDVSSFNTANVTDMYGMFSGCSNLTTLDVGSFNTGSVENMSSMFSGCKNLTTLDLSKFDTAGVENMSSMFSGCKNLTTLDLSKFDTSKVTDMSSMFSSCENLTALDLNKFDTSKVTDMSSMFIWCEKLTELDVSRFNTDNVTDMHYMFYGCSNLTKLDVSRFNTGSVKYMYAMFSDCENLTTLDLSKFDTASVTDMNEMFSGCKNLTTLDLSKFDTSNVTDMNSMFSYCENLITLDLSKFDTSNVTDMNSMFSYCENLITLDVSSFNTGNVTKMYWMFSSCKNLTTLDLNSFDACSVTEMFSMLDGCSNLTTIHTPRNVTQSVRLPAETGETWHYPSGAVLTHLPENTKDSFLITRIKKPNDDPSNDDPSDNDSKDDDGVLPEDIPEDGVIPEGLWNSKIADQTYTGAAIKPVVRIYNGKKRLKQGIDYTLSYLNNTKAAQSDDIKPPTVVVKGKGNYSDPEKIFFTITKRNISDMAVTKAFTNAYAPLANGKNPILVFSAKYNNRALKKNTDYTLTVKDSTGKEATSYGAVGTYTAVVKGAGNYTGEYSFPFEVQNKVPVSKLKISKIPAVNYDETSKTPEPVIKYGKVTLNKDKDYTLNYQNHTAIGTATIEITGMGDYFGTRNITFSIIGLQIKKAKFTGFQTSFPYTGGEVRQTATVLKYGDEELKEDRDYTVNYSNHRNKGKATVTYTGIGKYTGSLKKTYNITAYNIKTDAQKRIKLSTDTISTAYAKGGARPSLKVYDGTRLLTEGTDYTLSYQNNAAVTTSATVKQPTITVKGKGNYAGTFSEKKTFAITAKNIAEVTATAPDVAASTKTGKYKSTPVLTDSNGKKLKAGTDYDKVYTYTYKATTEKVLNNGAEVKRNAGDPVDANDIVPANTVLCVRIKAKEGSNYTGETTVEYRIVTSLLNKAKITVKNPAQNNANLFPYTGQAIRLDKSNLTVKVGKDVLSNDQYEIIDDTYKNNIGKGTASVQIKGVGNYGGTATVKFKIGTKSFQWVKRLFE